MTGLNLRRLRQRRSDDLDSAQVDFSRSQHGDCVYMEELVGARLPVAIFRELDGLRVVRLEGCRCHE